eukprot:gb/GECH01010483.1/.p1 GENE.gb/GECH01010483.1/~~gb/GECH01010483.1/.p1  ORF type:complete len:320 (+),score=80.41 gb/GECH01010483.1/:1-960(+)
MSNSSSSSSSKDKLDDTPFKSVQNTPVDKQSSRDFFWTYFKAINVDCQDTAGLLSAYNSIKNMDYSISKKLDSEFLNALFKTCVTVHLDPEARQCLPSNQDILDFLEVDKLYANQQPTREKSYDEFGAKIDAQIQHCLKNDKATARAARLIQRKGAASLQVNPEIETYVERAAAYHSANHPLCIDADQDKKGGKEDNSKTIFQKYRRSSQTICSEETKALMECQNRIRESLKHEYGNVPDAFVAQAAQQQCFRPMQKMFWCNFGALCAHPLQECITRRNQMSQGKVSSTAAFQQCFNSDQEFLKCTSRISDANFENMQQ